MRQELGRNLHATILRSRSSLDPSRGSRTQGRALAVVEPDHFAPARADEMDVSLAAARWWNESPAADKPVGRISGEHIERCAGITGCVRDSAPDCAVDAGHFEIRDVVHLARAEEEPSALGARTNGRCGRRSGRGLGSGAARAGRHRGVRASDAAAMVRRISAVDLTGRTRRRCGRLCPGSGHGLCRDDGLCGHRAAGRHADRPREHEPKGCPLELAPRLQAATRVRTAD